MFKFGFGEEDNNKTSAADIKSTPKPIDTSSQPARIVSITPEAPPPEEPIDVLTLIRDDLILRKTSTNVPTTLSATGADLIPGVYEGGFKLWECSTDLATYVHQQGIKATQSVLEIGAGHALPSLVALRSGASVTIHDFNEQVLKQATAPNVYLNAPTTTPRFAAGDWRTLPTVLNQRFDIILSAETVYNESQLAILANTVLDMLADTGIALFAGKSYYFGVGGGMRAFRAVIVDAARMRDIALDVDIVMQARDGKSNVREIAKFSRIQK